ncbi:MAG: GTP 3',8-cyclase MoaA [Crenarchaeota archaeon]|nr:GTP 3',8-cyclase MoaA [Thermoproteota archaeon]
MSPLHAGDGATPLYDRFGRPLTNLRVMVTGRCNFSCFFCHMEGYEESRAREVELSLDEIHVLAEAAKRVGVRAVKITGGEPTLREDLSDIVSLLSSHGFYVSMTTNASLLHRHLPAIVDAGIGHVNVSLHSLNPLAFQKITGSNLLDRVVENIKLLRDHGVPVKINTVILKGINEDDIERLVDFAAEVGASLQFIELHPVGRGVKTFREHHLPRWRVLEKLEGRIVEIRYRVGLHNRPVVLLDNGVRVEIVGPVGNHMFCAACTRIRVTYDFKLIPCLNWRGAPVEVRPRLASASSFEEKVEAVIEALRAVNRLREPYVKCPLHAPPIGPKRRWRIARLGLPKRDGTLSLVGRDPSRVSKLLAEEWGDYLA